MILTIGIPVYNGQKSIASALESIINYQFDRNNVEIIVSDNASNDETAQVVSGFPGVKLYRHSENIGFDGNLNRIFQYAKGKYVWAIGADDLIVSDVDAIVNILSNISSDIVFVGGKVELNSEHVIFEKSEEFLVQSGFRSGFFPNNIISREAWYKVDISSHLTSGWLHYAAVLQILRNNKSMITKTQYVIENPAIHEVKTWNSGGKGLLVGLKLLEIFHKMPIWGYNDSFVKRTKRVIKDSYPREIIVAKIRGLRISLKTLNKFIKLCRNFKSFWLIDIWLLMMPSFLFTMFCKPLRYFKLLDN